jgi:hypothetical protein
MRRAPPERSGVTGVPASDGDGGSGGAERPGVKEICFVH